MDTIKSIDFNPNSNTLRIINQLLLPHKLEYLDIKSVEDAWSAIRQMKVRGAPAIAITAILSLVISLHTLDHINNNGDIDIDCDGGLVQWIIGKLEYLKTSRPTAVNLFEACDTLSHLLTTTNTNNTNTNTNNDTIVKVVDGYARDLLQKDVENNIAIGRHGAEYLTRVCFPGTSALSIITHCNTGSLATAGYGTALGIIRTLQSTGHLHQIFCTETRPYNQGSRLTAFELLHDYTRVSSSGSGSSSSGIDSSSSSSNVPTLIADSMAAYLMSTRSKTDHPIHAIIVGADRIAANGDTANKIGTLQLAIVARYIHPPIKFIVAAPSSSIDYSCPSGSHIKVEERSALEMTHVTGYSQLHDCMLSVSVAPDSIGVWNPCFDVTPACLIDAIITETGYHLKENDTDQVFNLFTHSTQK